MIKNHKLQYDFLSVQTASRHYRFLIVITRNNKCPTFVSIIKELLSVFVVLGVQYIAYVLEESAKY